MDGRSTDRISITGLGLGPQIQQAAQANLKRPSMDGRSTDGRSTDGRSTDRRSITGLGLGSSNPAGYNSTYTRMQAAIKWHIIKCFIIKSHPLESHTPKTLKFRLTPNSRSPLSTRSLYNPII
jgi:hypothetical protein